MFSYFKYVMLSGTFFSIAIYNNNDNFSQSNKTLNATILFLFLFSGISSIVKSYSITQSLKGIATAGRLFSFLWDGCTNKAFLAG